MKIRKSTVATIAGATALLAAGSVGGAFAGGLINTNNIANNAVTNSKIASGAVSTRALASGAVTHGKIAPNSVGVGQLNLDARTKLNTPGPKGATGAAGQNAFVGTTSIVDTIGGAGTTIANIGGTFGKFTATVRATQVGSTLHLAAGTYLINSSADFERVNPAAAGTGNPILQLAVRGDDGSDWGQDYGTCFTGSFPNGPGNLDQTCSTTQLVTVPSGGLDIKVYGFGYNSDQSATGSGEYQVWANVQAVQINTN